MRVAYQTAPPPRARLGLIVLESDLTLEREAPRMMPKGVALHHARIPSAAEVTTDSLAAMEVELPRAARLLPPVDALGYACTSAAAVIGPSRVAGLLNASHPDTAATEPLSAVARALKALGARRIGFVTPYAPEVSAALRDRLTDMGFEIAGFASFEEPREARVAAIHPDSTHAAALSVARGADAIFASCTNLQTLDIVEDVEAETGLPFVSSNLALIWAMLRAAEVRAESGPGRLFGL